MSEELVNQLTLNYLISHTQLQKLNKKIKENQEDSKSKDLPIYKNRILQLFNDLLVNQQSDDILLDVKTSFDNFIDKSIYYFKMCDTNNNSDNNLNEDEETNDEETYDEEPIRVEPKLRPRYCKRDQIGTNNINNIPINWFAANLKKNKPI